MASRKKVGVIELRGLDECNAMLQTARNVVSSQAMVDVLLRGAFVIRDAAKSFCPVGTGTNEQGVPRPHLRDLIFATAGSARKAGGLLDRLVNRQFNVIVGVDRNKAPHAHLVEFGHGGPQPAPPHPFLRPAADSFAGNAANVIKTGIGELLDKAIR